MSRLIQVALLLAIIIPFGMVVRWGVNEMPVYWRDMAFAGLVGFILCYGLWHWSDRIRQRDGAGRRGD